MSSRCGMAPVCACSAMNIRRRISPRYRPPELLYGARKYGPAVDMWSIGYGVHRRMRHDNVVARR